MNTKIHTLDDVQRFVRVGSDAKGAFVRLGGDGLYHAFNWSGEIGAFATISRAEHALNSAPKRPKPKPASRSLPPDDPRLTAHEISHFVAVGTNPKAGSVIASGGKFSAHNWSGKIGEFDSIVEADAAVLAAGPKPTAKRGPSKRWRDMGR